MLADLQGPVVVKPASLAVQNDGQYFLVDPIALGRANAALNVATSAQPVNANLTALSAQVGAADELSYWTGVATLALTSLTAFGRTVLGYANAAALKTGLSLVKGDVGLGNVDNAQQVPRAAFTAADQFLYATGAGAYATASILAAWRSFLGSSKAVWDETNGRLGIGLTPSTTFEVGQATAGLSANMRLRGDANSSTKYMDVFSGTASGLYSYGAQDFWFGCGGALRMLITAGGRIGFNRADPAYLMHNSSSTLKSLGGQTQLWFMSTAEAQAYCPFGLLTSVTGASTNANRIIDISTTEYNTAWAGNLVLQRYGGNVGIGTGDTPPAVALDVVGAVKASVSLAIGGGTAITKTVVYTPSLTPAATGGFGLSVQTFTVAGLTTTDTVQVNGPANAANSQLIHWRISAADTLELTFLTTAAATPAAGVYRVLATRS